MQQYVDMKAENPDALLMFRLGDFYESFFEDAKIVIFLRISTMLSHKYFHLIGYTREREEEEEEEE
ncbi:MAG: hypothetical protein IJO18_02820, partial [Alphaproteobacteria bacterium]|nr:hypothetical protein [Alphaproteobacteria bacterium]